MTRKELGVLLLLVALCTIVAIASPQFLSVTNVQNVARLVGTYGMFSIGVGIVMTFIATRRRFEAGIRLALRATAATRGHLPVCKNSPRSARKRTRVPVFVRISVNWHTFCFGYPCQRWA